MSVNRNFKYLLAQMAFEAPMRFLTTFADEGGPRYLRDLWNGMQMRALGDDFQPTDALDVQVHGRTLLLVLPPPTERNDAIAVAVTGGPDGLRVFVLELGDPAGKFEAFIVEIIERGRKNYGPWDEPDLAKFAARVDELSHPRS
ncbi:MAG TPA: hypothetical protein VM869_12965 [Enhygromyxa sp.]|nr:hypothetical protein [Enhygromyxa sp.]